MEIKKAYLILTNDMEASCKNNPETFISYENIKKDLEKIIKYEVNYVIILGGEPTLHPHFFDIINDLSNARIKIEIISNSESFAEQSFLKEYIKYSKKGSITITTTLHSHNIIRDDEENTHYGISQKTLDGLINLGLSNLKFTIRHPITKYNYKNLPLFVKFSIDKFSDNAEIQLCGMDCSGVNEEIVKENFVSFYDIKPYIEKSIDIFEDSKTKKVLTLNKLPLCMCDCYYWAYYLQRDSTYEWFTFYKNYRSFPTYNDYKYARRYYDSYIDYVNGGEKIRTRVGPVSKNCEGCSFRSDCLGTHHDLFRIIGDNIVAHPKYEVIAEGNRADWKSPKWDYEIRLNPFVKSSINNDGLIFYINNSDLTQGVRTYVKLNRLTCKQIFLLQHALNIGITKRHLKLLLKDFGLDVDYVYLEMLLKRIIWEHK